MCSNDSWSTPPPLGRKHSCISFWRTLCSFYMSLYFPLEFPLNSVSRTVAFQELVLLLRFHWKDPSTFHLPALPITSSVIVTWISMMFERIYVLLNGFKPISSLVFPSRLGSINTFSWSSHSSLDISNSLWGRTCGEWERWNPLDSILERLTDLLPAS